MEDEQIAQFNEVIDTFWALSDAGRATASRLLMALLNQDVEDGVARGIRKR